MSLSLLIFCFKCGKTYDEEARKPCVGACKHTICSSCFDALASANCLICEKKDAFLADKKTFSVQLEETLKILRSCKNKENHHDGFSPSLLETYQQCIEEPDNGLCSDSSCGKWSRKLLVCLDCNKDSGLLETKDDVISLKLTPKTKKKTETFLRLQNISICAQCAADSHQGHNVIRMMSLKNVFNYFAMLVAKDTVSQTLTKEFGIWSKRIRFIQNTVKELTTSTVKKTSRAAENTEGVPYLPFNNPLLDCEARLSAEKLAKWERKTLRIQIYNFNKMRITIRSLIEELEFYKSLGKDQTAHKETEAALKKLTKLYEQVRKCSLRRSLCTRIGDEFSAKREEMENKLRAEFPLPRGEDPRLFYKFILTIRTLKQYAEDFLPVKAASAKDHEAREHKITAYKQRLAEIEREIRELPNTDEADELEDALFDEGQRLDETALNYVLEFDKKMILMEKFAYSRFFVDRLIDTWFKPEAGAAEKKYFDFIMEFLSLNQL